MKWSQTHLYTLKEAPSDADILSQQLFVRAGLIKKLAPGIFTFGPVGLRALRKFEGIIREELEKRGLIEVLMPMVHPKELWEETGRWTKMGEGLLKFKNRNGQWFCLGATHEEAITDYVRYELQSYRDLPKNFFQIQTKYRDELRPRFGLMRGREFIMKDAYSFDLDKPSALKSYQIMYDAYKAIFDRLKVEYRIVEADAGSIGGSLTHEFQLIADAGEDALMVSDGSDFAANREVCPAIDPNPVKLTSNQESGATVIPFFEEFATPNLKSILDLETSYPDLKPLLVKTLFFKEDKPEAKIFAVVLRGQDEVNPIKLKNVFGFSQEPIWATDQEVVRVTGVEPGSCGPLGLNIDIYLDNGVTGLPSVVVGANKKGYHLKNVVLGRDFKATAIGDYRMAKSGDQDPKNPSGRLSAVRGIEVGHVFYLGTQYSEKMNARYLTKDQKSQTIEMGCYGIGVSRTIQAVIEQCHDKDGMIWPMAISPFLVHICVLDVKEKALLNLAESLEKSLLSFGVDTLIDDRDERPGVKFKDADLLGFPLRITLGKKGFDKGAAEFVTRKNQNKIEVPLAQMIEKAIEVLKEIEK